MKKATFLFSLLISLSVLHAQDKLPSFGKVDKADLELKDCDFDPGAEALVLFDVGEIEISYAGFSGWQSVSVYRTRIKILKTSAVDRAQIKLRYYSYNRSQEITNVKGISFNLDAGGNIVETEMESKAVFDKVIDKKWSEVSFAIPNVKVGSVFEFKYRHVRKSYSYIPAWNFQSDIPVKYSAYYANVPEYFQFTVQSTLRQKMEDQKKGSGDPGKWYILRNVPGLKKEPYSSGSKDYVQRVQFKLSRISSPSYNEEFQTTWEKITEQLLEDEDFGLAIKKNLRGTSDLDAKLPFLTSNKERIRTVYKYVQANMQWDGSYGIYSDNGIKDAWDKKNGSVTDINFILLRLVRDAGIEAKPLLVSTKENGAINAIYPFLNQFNCAMVYVQDGTDVYIMNAADKYNPFNLVPYDVLYTDGLVVDKKTGGIVRLNGEGRFENTVFFTCAVEEDGKLSGQATGNSWGYARNVRMQKNNKGRLREVFEDNSGINIKVDSLEVKNEKDELLPLEQNIQFSGSMQSSGDYYFLPYNLFTNLGKNLFIEDKRVMDIDFDYPQKYSVSGSWFLPDNFSVSELPKNTKVILPDTSIVLSRMLQLEGSIISFRFSVEFKASGYAAESYPYIKEFFKQLYTIMDERIVLKKK